MKGGVPFWLLVSLLRPFSAVWWNESGREAQTRVSQRQHGRARDENGYETPFLGFSDAPHTWMV